MSRVDEYSVMESLQAFISSHMATDFTTGSVVIDFPEPSNMPKSLMAYIYHDNSEYAEYTTMEDIVTGSYVIALAGKGNKRITVVKKLYELKDTLVELLRSHQNLDDGATDTIVVTGVEFYPSIASTGIVPCLELTVQAQFVKAHD